MLGWGHGGGELEGKWEGRGALRRDAERRRRRRRPPLTPFPPASGRARTPGLGPSAAAPPVAYLIFICLLYAFFLPLSSSLQAVLSARSASPGVNTCSLSRRLRSPRRLSDRRVEIQHPRAGGAYERRGTRGEVKNGRGEGGSALPPWTTPT